MHVFWTTRLTVHLQRRSQTALDTTRCIFSSSDGIFLITSTPPRAQSLANSYVTVRSCERNAGLITAVTEERACVAHYTSSHFVSLLLISQDPSRAVMVLFGSQRTSPAKTDVQASRTSVGSPQTYTKQSLWKVYRLGFTWMLSTLHPRSPPMYLFSSVLDHHTTLRRDLADRKQCLAHKSLHAIHLDFRVDRQ